MTSFDEGGSPPRSVPRPGRLASRLRRSVPYLTLGVLLFQAGCDDSSRRASGPGRVTSRPQAAPEVPSAGLVTSGLAMSGVSAPKALPIAAPALWKVKVDPPAVPMQVAEAGDLAFPMAFNDQVHFPTPPGPFVAVGRNASAAGLSTVYDLRTTQPAGTIHGLLNPILPPKLSPDGQYLLVNSAPPRGVKGTFVEVWSFRTGQRARAFLVQAGTRPTTVNLFGFSGPGRVVAGHMSKEGYRIGVWDIATGKRLHELMTGRAPVQERNHDLSPGGRYLAVAVPPAALEILDLETGEAAARMELPGGVGGMRFSPDGSELAAMIGDPLGRRLLVWDVANGSVLVDHLIRAGGDAADLTAWNTSFEGPLIEWRPDGTAWLVNGQVIVDRSGGRPTWLLSTVPHEAHPGRRLLLDGERMLVVTGSVSSEHLAMVPLPWSTIDAGLKAMVSDAPAFVRPGQPVSVKLDIDPARYKPTEESRALLTKYLTDRLIADGIPTADGQPTVLHLNYGPEGDPASGLIRGVLNLEAEGVAAPLWSAPLDLQPPIPFLQGEPADSPANQDPFRQVVARLRRAPIPYFIPKDESIPRLPGTTEIHVEPANPAATPPRSGRGLR